MNLDQAHCLLTNKIKEVHNPNFGVSLLLLCQLGNEFFVF
jgi:hypothetical protein